MSKNEIFRIWLYNQFLSWEDDLGNRQTYTSFSKFLNVNRSSLGLWINGLALPGNDNVIKLANKLGWEIYDILEWEKPILKK